jgi:protoporphyrinogen oxidase
MRVDPGGAARSTIAARVSGVGRIVILGAGPTGLGAAHRLRELGHGDFVVYEREDQVGGLAASFQDENGFTWDTGVHVLFSRSDQFNAVMDAMLDGALIEHRRDAQVWLHGSFVPYPLQYNLHRLPDPLRRDCLLGLARAAATPQSTPPSSFLDWIERSFGDGIARHFMLPYNRKVWCEPLDGLDVGWIAERVPRPDLERALAHFLDSRDDDGWGPNARFRYPRAGGIGAIWRRCAQQIGLERIVLKRPAARIDTANALVRFADGSDERYDALISTLPVDRLAAMTGIEALQRAAAPLRSTTVHVVGIGLEGATPGPLVDRRWMYFPDPSLPFYRASVLSNFSPANAPAGHWSLLAEVSSAGDRPVDTGRLIDAVVAGLRREGIIPAASNVVRRWHHVAAPGYPIPTRGRDPALAHLLPALEDLGIFSRGRHGAWRYEISNQDQSFLQGVELADRLVLGKAETMLESTRDASRRS